MPEFKVFTTIEAPYDVVWEMASVVSNVEQWSPVKFKNVAAEETLVNGLYLEQVKKQFGFFGSVNLEVLDAFTNSKVRRQYSFADIADQYRFNRITYMFDDNSIQTMIELAEDDETRKILEEQAKSEPKYQIKIMAHVFYTFGSAFWRTIVEALFITPFFKLAFHGKVKKSMQRFKELSEKAYAEKLAKAG